MWIESVRIEGGLLDGFEQRFSDGLNVLVGGRGTGKSSVIELIRFCLRATSYTERGQQEATEHALGVLGDGRVTVMLTDGRDRIEVSRTAQDTEAESFLSYRPPFVFSQSEIETIGLQAQSRLRLIDGFIPDDEETAPFLNPLASKIRSATAEMRAILAEIDDISERTGELAKLQAQLEATKAQIVGHSEVHKEIDNYRNALAEVTPLVAAARVRSEVIGRSIDRISGWVASFEALLERKPALEPWPTQAGALDELADLRGPETQASSRLRAGLSEMQAIAAELEHKGTIAASQKVGLENRARDIRQRIEEKQAGASVLDKRINDLTQQISVLQSLVELRKERQARVDELMDQRELAIHEPQAGAATRAL